jgi:hypothetical protein
MVTGFQAEQEAAMRTIRIFILVEAIAFGIAASIHFGILMDGYEHLKAGIAESVIGSVLLIGWLATSASPEMTKRAGIGVQAFALFGTFVGIFTILIGVGPRTGPDIVFHALLVALLGAGLFMATKSRFA